MSYIAFNYHQCQVKFFKISQRNRTKIKGQDLLPRFSNTCILLHIIPLNTWHVFVYFSYLFFSPHSQEGTYNQVNPFLQQASHFNALKITLIPIKYVFTYIFSLKISFFHFYLIIFNYLTILVPTSQYFHWISELVEMFLCPLHPLAY